MRPLLSSKTTVSVVQCAIILSIGAFRHVHSREWCYCLQMMFDLPSWVSFGAFRPMSELSRAICLDAQFAYFL